MNKARTKQKSAAPGAGSPNATRARAPRAKEPAEKPVSLAPLDFETALTGLLKVKPEKKARFSP